MRVVASLVLIFLCNLNGFAQDSIGSQVERLHQYSGHWVSSEHADTDSVGTFPAVEMNNISTMNNQSMQVEVLQYQNGKYQS
jgi:hypothetical protein